MTAIELSIGITGIALMLFQPFVTFAIYKWVNSKTMSQASNPLKSFIYYSTSPFMGFHGAAGFFMSLPLLAITTNQELDSYFLYIAVPISGFLAIILHAILLRKLEKKYPEYNDYDPKNLKSVAKRFFYLTEGVWFMVALIIVIKIASWGFI